MSKKNKTLMIKKVSEYRFLDLLVTSNKSLLGVLYFLKRKKFDYLIITKIRILYIIRNKVIKNISYNYNFKVSFNSMKNRIEFYNSKQKKEYIELHDFKITLNEIQQIKSILS
ncbi:hypothetical protein GCM10022396_29110 [Flavivirga amylovorans]